MVGADTAEAVEGVSTAVAEACAQPEGAQAVAARSHALRLETEQRGVQFLPRQRVLRGSRTALQIDREIIFRGRAGIFRTAMSASEIPLQLREPGPMASGILSEGRTVPQGRRPRLEQRTAPEDFIRSAEIVEARPTLRAVFQDRAAKSGRILRPLATWSRSRNLFRRCTVLS